MTGERSADLFGDVDETAERIIALLHELGVEGHIAYDKPAGRLVHERIPPFYFRDIHVEMRSVDEDEREGWLRRTVAKYLSQPRSPETWDEARAGILPHIQTRATQEIQRLRQVVDGASIPVVPCGVISDHLAVELAWPDDESIVRVSREDLERWGVTFDDALAGAGRNLEQRSQGRKWLGSPQFPGVLRSPWSDRFDGARAVFAADLGLPFVGPPVAVAVSPSMLLLADGDDEDALFNLGRAAKKELARTRTFLWLKPIRLDREAFRWEEWLPATGTASHGILKFLWAAQDVAEYQATGDLLDRLAAREGSPVRCSAIDVAQDLTGAAGSITYWDDGPPQALPYADVVAFRRGEDTLAVAPMSAVLADLGDVIEERPAYPIRYVTRSFPEDTQLARLRRPESL